MAAGYAKRRNDPLEDLTEVRRGLDTSTKPIPRWDVHFGILKMTVRIPRFLASPARP